LHQKPLLGEFEFDIDAQGIRNDVLPSSWDANLGLHSAFARNI
jgi:hypothetical protein